MAHVELVRNTVDDIVITIGVCYLGKSSAEQGSCSSGTRSVSYVMDARRVGDNAHSVRTFSVTNRKRS